MRRSSGPKRAEMTRRFVADITRGALTFNPYANLAFLGAKGAYMFVRTRHGVPTDRSARVRAYVQVQHALGEDTALAPALRAEFARRVHALDTNPLERSWDHDVRTAVAQHAAFLQYVESADGLARQLRSDREQELRASHFSSGQRAWMHVAKVASFGAYKAREQMAEPELATLAARRRENGAKSGDGLPPLPAPAVVSQGGAPAGESAQSAFR
jgi:hypothetical protein